MSATEKIKVAIIGGAGYTGGETLRLLALHPHVGTLLVQSSSHAGEPVTDVHPDLLGYVDNQFVKEIDGTVDGEVDVVFLCGGHGQSAANLQKIKLASHTKIIDLSQDYRIASKDNDFIYGLPELNRESIRNASKVANPGCFATAISLALLPLGNSGLLTSDLHITAVTGSTGAGQSLAATSHYSWRNSNMSVYKAFQHQHEAEILQSLRSLQPTFNHDFNLIPMRGSFTRGILVSLHLKCDQSSESLQEIYRNFYASQPFCKVTAASPDLKQVINTNHCFVNLQRQGKYLHIVSVIDNLLKGASGQAVQNMNLMFGFAETTGLMLKPVAF